MARYIDADIALDKMKNWHTQERLMDCVRNTPTADVVEVVRCKDCKFNVSNMTVDELDETDYSGADIVCSFHMSDGFDADDFCSYGERRDT